jgi:uncharacterized protein (TIGR02246 family)
MRREGKRFVPALVVAAMALGLMLAGKFAFWPSASEAQVEGRTEAAPAAGAAGKDGRDADRAALAKTVQSFIAAFERGDAKAVAAHWTTDGEYIADDGTTLRGRAAIEKSYTELFGKDAKHKVEIEVDTVRFPSKDTAIEEGHFRVRRGKAEDHARSRYTVLHVREGGNWLMAVVREWPVEAVSLRDVDWLIGTWSAKRDGIEVHTTYEWHANKNFIRGTYTIKGKDATHTGFQMIGKDASTGTLRSWTFDNDGGFGDAVWSRDGKKWVQESAGVLADGSTLSANNVITRLDDDAFSWHSINRSLDGEEMPNLPPIKVTRVKTKK